MKRLCLSFLGFYAAACAFGAEIPLPSAVELFDRHFAVTGIALSTQDFRALTVQGHLSSEGRRSTFTLRILEPSIFVLTVVDEDRRTARMGRDADGRFWQENGRRFQDLDRAVAVELSAVVTSLFPPAQWLLRDRLEDAVCERDRAEGRPVTAVGRKRIAHRNFPRLLFDEETGLLVRVGRCRLSHYQLVGNLHLPFRIQQGAEEVYEIREVRWEMDVKEQDFARPGRSRGWLSSVSPNIIQPSHRASTLLSPSGQLDIVRRPPAAGVYLRGVPTLPKFDPHSGRHNQVDLRTANLSKLDLSESLMELLHADFDTRTVWPSRVPAGFDPAAVLELGKNPGLGVRQLHARGITGKGVGVATIDFPLLTGHPEYADRLRLYEEIQSPAGIPAHMHGCAVASIAVGKTCGVAPEADLYHVASLALTTANGKTELDYAPIAKAIHRLLDINLDLPRDRRIRVISISMGWSPGQRGFPEAMDAVARGNREGVFVLSTALRKTHNLRFDGLGRPALADPDRPESYGPGSWWAQMFWNGETRFKPGSRLCVPMDGRTTASPTGPGDYVHYDYAGWSWAVPWVAGLYALACQVCPEITPERFWAEALRTGATISVSHDGESADLGTLADPQALLQALAPP